MHKLLTLALPLIVLSSSCNSKKPDEKKTANWDVENTKTVELYDETNKLAIQEAQDSLSFFIKLFNGKKKNGLAFYIKSKFNDEKNIENMWSFVNSISSDTVFATLNNVPLKLTNFKLNDRVKILREKIEDWVIYKGDSVLYGDFIVKHTK